MSWPASRPLVWSQSVGVLATTSALSPRVSSMPVTRSSSEGLPRTPCSTAIVAPSGRFSASQVPASLPPARLSVATTEVLPSQSGMSLSISTTGNPGVDSLLQLFGDVRAGGRDRDRVHVLRDHRLDRGDDPFVVGAALALGEDDFGPRLVGVPLLGGIDHDVVEVDGELRDKPDGQHIICAVRRSVCRARARGQQQCNTLRWRQRASVRCSSSLSLQS